MASPEAIAQGGSVVTADQINYEQKMFSHTQTNVLINHM